MALSTVAVLRRSPEGAAAAGGWTCACCSWLKRFGCSEPLAAWRASDDAFPRGAATLARAARVTDRWPTSQSDGVDAATSRRRRVRRGRPNTELKDEQKEPQRQLQQQPEQRQGERRRRRRPQLRRRQQLQQQREGSSGDHFQHHPEDIGWYMRQYCIERATRLRCKPLLGGSGGGGGSDASGPPLFAAAEDSSLSCLASADGASMKRPDEAVSGDRSRSSLPLWTPRVHEPGAACSRRKNEGDGTSQHATMNERTNNFVSQKGVAIDQLVEKLMRRQRVSSVNGKLPELSKPQSTSRPSSASSLARAVECGDGERPTLAQNLATKCRHRSHHTKVHLPATAIDMLKRFGLGAAIAAHRERDRIRPLSAVNDQGPTRSSLLLPTANAARNSVGSAETTAPHPPLKAKTTVVGINRARVRDDAKASAASLDEALLAIAPDNRPFLESKTKQQGSRGAKLGGNRLQARAVAAAHTGAAADVSNTAAAVWSLPSGANLRDGSSSLRRRPAEPTIRRQPADCIESDKALLLSVLYTPLVACYLNESDRVAAHAGDAPGQVARACLVDYSGGYWSVQSL